MLFQQIMATMINCPDFNAEVINSLFLLTSANCIPFVLFSLNSNIILTFFGHFCKKFWFFDLSERCFLENQRDIKIPVYRKFCKLYYVCSLRTNICWVSCLQDKRDDKSTNFFFQHSTDWQVQIKFFRKRRQLRKFLM